MIVPREATGSVRSIAVKAESHGDGVVGKFVEALLKSRKSDRVLIARILRDGLGESGRERRRERVSS
jgi:hypothetical protein